ncbi:MAG TPA: FAD:protein FMN transferase [Patescibacteria group bacterium]|nr:FAD:protein FMN transferase [Patescibacteria group bacterium]
MKMNFKALGTDIAVEIVSKKFYPKLENEVIEFYQQKEKIFSRFDPGSELAFLNMNTGRLIDAASDIIEIAARSLAYYKKTAGYFDPRIIGILENVGYDKDFKDIAAGHVQKSNKVNLNDNLSGQLKIEEDKIYFG